MKTPVKTAASSLRRRWVAACVAVAALASGCGYTLQTSKGSSLEKEGVRAVYIEPLQNVSYKAGVENLVYNALVQVVSSHRRVRIVGKPEEADAVLRGKVTKADYVPNVTTPSDSIFPTTRKTLLISVATEYLATVSCSFTLVRDTRPQQTEKVLWASSFTRNKRFPGNNQKDEFGTTAAILNESEFDRALSDIATEMMRDVHEAMLAMF